jgi:copper homeostasis protein (lipoprotein)
MPLTTVTPPGIYTEESALDWTGIYAGTLPCANCPGIRARLVLNENQTYLYEWSYLDAPEEHHHIIGNVIWDPEVNTITLDGIDSSLLPAIYSVGPDTITQYVAEELPDMSTTWFLERQQQVGLLETRWVLTELHGESIPGNHTFNTQPYIRMSVDNNRISGNGSCNNFFGTYIVREDSQIIISGIGSTKMMCPDMDIETRFFEALENANSYYIHDDMLVLVQDANITAARFRAE